MAYLFIASRVDISSYVKFWPHMMGESGPSLFWVRHSGALICVQSSANLCQRAAVLLSKILIPALTSGVRTWQAQRHGTDPGRGRKFADRWRMNLPQEERERDADSDKQRWRQSNVLVRPSGTLYLWQVLPHILEIDTSNSSVKQVAIPALFMADLTDQRLICTKIKIDWKKATKGAHQQSSNGPSIQQTDPNNALRMDQMWRRAHIRTWLCPWDPRRFTSLTLCRFNSISLRRLVMVCITYSISDWCDWPVFHLQQPRQKITIRIQKTWRSKVIRQGVYRSFDWLKQKARPQSVSPYGCVPSSFPMFDRSQFRLDFTCNILIPHSASGKRGKNVFTLTDLSLWCTGSSTLRAN